MNTSLPRDLDLISQRLVAARASAQSLPEFPGDLPGTLEDAYTVQAASIERWPDEVAGWKVGMVPPEFQRQLAAERLAGPIYRSSIFAIEPNATQAMSIFQGGFAAVEAEFVIKLGTTIEPVEQARSDAALTDLVAAVHVGAEIASSPLPGVNDLGPCCVVSDFGNNAGLVLGPDIPNWASVVPETMTAAVHVDNILVGQASAAVIEGGLLQAFRFLVELSARRGITLPAGTYVSCGAVTGIHEITAASKAHVDFGTFGAFDVTFEPMTPTQPSAASAKG